MLSPNETSGLTCPIFKGDTRRLRGSILDSLGLALGAFDPFWESWRSRELTGDYQAAFRQEFLREMVGSKCWRCSEGAFHVVSSRIFLESAKHISMSALNELRHGVPNEPQIPAGPSLSS